jgi:hypothetical protein
MKPESRKSSFLGNGSRKVPAEMYTHAKNKRSTVSMQRRIKQTYVTTDKWLGDGAFYVVRAEML